MLKQLQSLDAALSLRLTLSPDSMGQQIARIIAHVGDGQYVFGMLGLIYLLGWLKWDQLLRWVTLVVALKVGIAILVVMLVKFAVRRQRPRPPGEFVAFRYDVYSFPSGHSARLAALTISTAFVYPPGGWFLGIITLLVGAARIAVGVHYVSDVLVGLGLGTFVAWFLTWLTPYYLSP